MKLFWGFLFVLLGIVILINNLGLSWGVNFDYLWNFWPALLVLFGIALMVRGLRFGGLILLIAFIAAGGAIYALSRNESFNKKITTEKNVEIVEFSEDMPGGATKGSVSIDSGASEVNMGSTNDKLIKGSLSSNFFKPVLKVDRDGSTVNVDLSMDNNVRWNDWAKKKNEFNVELTNRIPLDLTVDAGASKLNLDLTNLIISGLTIRAGATSVDLKIGDNIIDSANINVKVGASEVNISVPENIGIRATVKSGLSSKELDGFKNLGEGNYESDNFSSAAKKININIDSGVSSINIDRK